MVMGNASGGNDGEGPSGTKKFEGNYASHHNRVVPLHRPQGLIQSFRHSVYLSWNNGGKQVAVTGSWDNWETKEHLQETGTGGFHVVKTLPPGEYQYLFIVDNCLRCAPDLPWICDDSGNAYNVLDLQECDSELPESLSEFNSPSSPPSSYDNKYLNEDDFSKPPPETPPQLQASILNEPSYSNDAQPQSLRQPQRSELNHLYIHHHTEGQFVALGSTRRFREKYVTMVLYKPFRRTS